MLNTKSAALFAIFTIGFVSTALAAGVPSTHPVPPPIDHPGGGGNCTANCSPPPPPTDLPPTSEQAFHVCSDKLSQLRRVTVAEIKSITPDDKVKIIPVCETRLHSLTEAETAFIESGNAGGLLGAIAESVPLVDKLAERRYAANDVIGVIVDGPSAVLYVHKR